MPRLHTSAPAITLGIVLTFLPGGCASYTLEGRVVRGDFGDVMFVDPDRDPYAEAPGIPGVAIRVIRDPDRLSRKVAAGGRSGPSGDLSIPIGEFGAGWMQELWLVQASRAGYETVEQIVAFPSGRKRVVIVMRDGESTELRTLDPLREEFERHR